MLRRIVYGGGGGGGCSQIISGHLERPAGASTYVSEGEKKFRDFTNRFVLTRFGAYNLCVLGIVYIQTERTLRVGTYIIYTCIYLHVLYIRTLKT